MTRRQRRFHLWAWPLAALAIVACTMLALDARHRVSAALDSAHFSEAR